MNMDLIEWSAGKQNRGIDIKTGLNSKQLQEYSRLNR